MRLPENIQKFLVGYPYRVIVDLDRLCVITKAVISRIPLCPSPISYTGANNTRNTPEPGVRTPESAESKGSRPDRVRENTVDRWNCVITGSFCIYHCLSHPFL